MSKTEPKQAGTTPSGPQRNSVSMADQNSEKKAVGPKGDSVSAHRLIEQAVHRLALIVEEETSALRGNVPVDLKEFNNRKSMGLYELQNALRLLEGRPPAAATRQLLDQLNAKLDENQHVLKIHLEAVHEITAIIANTIKQADSDGTYTFSFRSKEPPS